MKTRSRTSRTVRNAWHIIRTAAGVFGFILWLGAAGTADFHTLQLMEETPPDVWRMILLGSVLIAPAVLHIVRTCYIEEARR